MACQESLKNRLSMTASKIASHITEIEDIGKDQTSPTPTSWTQVVAVSPDLDRSPQKGAFTVNALTARVVKGAKATDVSKDSPPKVNAESSTHTITREDQMESTFHQRVKQLWLSSNSVRSKNNNLIKSLCQKDMKTTSATTKKIIQSHSRSPTRTKRGTERSTILSSSTKPSLSKKSVFRSLHRNSSSLSRPILTSSTSPATSSKRRLLSSNLQKTKLLLLALGHPSSFSTWMSERLF